MHARWIGRERPKVLSFKWKREAHDRIEWIRVCFYGYFPYIYIYIYGILLGNKYKVEYIVIYKYVGQIGYGVRYHIIASFLHYLCVH